jgi:hypothetical protein
LIMKVNNLICRFKISPHDFTSGFRPKLRRETMAALTAGSFGREKKAIY